MALRTHTITATTGGNLFPKAYADRIVFVPNGFGMDTNIGNPIGSYSRWEFQVDNTSGTSSECQPGLVYDQAPVVRWKIQNFGEFQARVKAFSAAVIGTMFGRYESSGVGCGSVGLVGNNRRRANVSPLHPDYLNNSPVYDMEDVKKLTGFPCHVGDLEDVRIEYDLRTSGGGNQNKFLDMYLHDVSDGNRIVGGFPGPGYGTDDPFTSQAIASDQQQLLNTINGINYNLTKDWNINVWLGVPEIPNDVPIGRDSDNNWAGGTLIGRYNIGGIDHDFYYKLETAGANNFDYIGLVMINPQDAGSIRVLDYINFAKNTLPGIISSNPDANALYGNATTRGKPPPRMPDDNHVLGGLHFGSELFYSNVDGSEAVVEFRKLLFTVPSIGTFGWSKSGVPETNANPDYSVSVALNESVSITPIQVGNNSPFFDTPSVDEARASVTSLSPLTIRGNSVGSTVIEYVQEDGTTGKILLTITGGDVVVNPDGQSTNYRDDVVLGSTLSIDWVQIHTSGEEINNIPGESGPDKVKIEGLSPKITVRGVKLGTSLIEYETVNGFTGTFTINTIADVDDPDPDDDNPIFIGTRWVNPGNTIKLNMNLMPELFQDNDRNVVDTTGPGSAIVVGDDLEITVPVTNTGSGTVEID